MPISQVTKTEDQVWNNDAYDFFRKNTTLLTLIPSNFTTPATNPLRIQPTFDGYWKITGKIQFSAPVSAAGKTKIADLPDIFSDGKLLEINMPQYVEDTGDATGASDFIVGIGVDYNTKELYLYDRNNAFATDQNISVSIDLFSSNNFQS